MKVLASFSTTKFRQLRATWAMYESLKSEISAIGTTREDEEFCGGMLVMLDWHSKKIEQTSQINRASGLLHYQGNFLVGAYDRILILDLNFNLDAQISHSVFNNVHGLCELSKGIAVASTGIDSIVFMDDSFKLKEVWCALKHGFVSDQVGNERHISFDQDHRKIMYPTLLHTTHLNSVVCLQENPTILYISFFHQGEVKRLDCSNNTLDTVIGGLQAPHSITRLDDGRFMIADSANNRLVVWSSDEENPKDGNLEVNIIDLRYTCDWIQDAKEFKVSETFLVADCNNCRIIEVDWEGKIIDYWHYDEDWKIQEIMTL